MASAIIGTSAVTGMPYWWLAALSQGESNFNPVAGVENDRPCFGLPCDTERGHHGAFQQSPRYIDAYWPYPGQDPHGPQVIALVESSAIAAAAWLAKLWRDGQRIAAELPEHSTFLDQALANTDLYEAKELDPYDARPVPIPTPRPNAWLAHYNRGAGGAGRYPDFAAPNRADGSEYQIAATRRASSIRDEVGPLVPTQYPPATPNEATRLASALGIDASEFYASPLLAFAARCAAENLSPWQWIARGETLPLPMLIKLAPAASQVLEQLQLNLPVSDAA